MRLKHWTMAILLGATLGVLGVSLYWLWEPQILFTRPIVQVIKQYRGEAVSIAIAHDQYAIAGDYTLTVSIVSENGLVINRTRARALKLGRKYIVLTDASLAPGLFDVTAEVEYRLNPMRTVSEEVQIAILKVMEEK